MWSYSAWKRRPGDRLAAAHSRRCSCRTLSVGLRPPGWLGPVLPAIPSRLPAPTTRPPQGPFPPDGVVRRAPSPVLRSPRTPAAQRPISPSAYTGPPCRDDGGADGSLVFRTSPCTRAAPRTPPGPRRRLRDSCERRCLRRDMSGSAPGLFLCRGCRLHFMLRPACLLPAARLTPPRGLLTPRSGLGVSPDAWGLLPGAPALTGAGLSPAGDAQRADAGLPGNLSSASRRTMGGGYQRSSPSLFVLVRPCSSSPSSEKP